MSTSSRLALAIVLLAGCPGTRGGGGGPGASVGGPPATPRELADQVVAALAARAPDVEALAMTAADIQRHCPDLPPAMVAEVAQDDRETRAEGWKRCSEAGDWTGARVDIATGGAVEKSSEQCPGIEVLDTIEVKVKLAADEVMMTLVGLRVGGDVYKVGDQIECVVTVPE
jgi:hypothetical protein